MDELKLEPNENEKIEIDDYDKYIKIAKLAKDYGIKQSTYRKRLMELNEKGKLPIGVEKNEKNEWIIKQKDISNFLDLFRIDMCNNFLNILETDAENIKKIIDYQKLKSKAVIMLDCIKMENIHEFMNEMLMLYVSTGIKTSKTHLLFLTDEENFTKYAYCFVTALLSK